MARGKSRTQWAESGHHAGIIALGYMLAGFMHDLALYFNESSSTKDIEFCQSTKASYYLATIVNFS